MSDHQKAYDLLNDSVELLASSSDELQYRLSVVCRGFLSQLTNSDLCAGLSANFLNLSKKLNLQNDFDYFLSNLEDGAEASHLAKAICQFRNQVCEEYHRPGSY